MYCKNCGKDIGDAKYCSHCGTAAKPNEVIVAEPNKSKNISITGIISFILSILSLFLVFIPVINVTLATAGCICGMFAKKSALGFAGIILSLVLIAFVIAVSIYGLLIIYIR